ncbi:MAG: FtsX-like permease family protein, partial [Clostridiales bacterium]|nr:FtsX-like permease family protein [Clostridiales bacterium]
LQMGRQDVIIFDCKDAPLNDLVEDNILSEYGTASILGYVLPDGKNEGNGFSIAKFDDTALNLIHRDVLEGRLPVKVGEAALEQSALARLLSEAGVGDTIQLTYKVPNGDDFMNEPVQKSFILTGILKDKLVYLNHYKDQIPAYADFPAAVLSADEEITPGGRAVINAYGVYAQEANTAFKHLIEFSKNASINDNSGSLYKIRDTSNRIIPSKYAFYYQEDFSIHIISIFFVAIALVLVMASCIGIINAFSTNLEARKRQIGLLRAVGATKKQIRDIFGREALILALLSIPLGILLASFTVWGITYALGDQFVFKLNPYIIAIVSVAGILCVMTAASIPLKKASRIPPMQAIHNVALSRKMKRNRVKSRVMYDVPRHIARRNIILYKNKQLAITAMLTVSILLISLLVFSLVPLFGELKSSYNPNDYDYVLRNTSLTSDWLMEYDFNQPGMTEQDKLDISALPLVRTVIGEKILQVKTLLDRTTPYIMGGHQHFANYLSPEPWQSDNSLYYEDARKYAEQNHQIYLNSKEKYEYSQDYFTVNICGTDSELIEKLTPFVYDGHINLEKLSSGEEILIFAPNEYSYSEGEDETGNWTRVDYSPDMDASQSTIYENDIFQAGDTITLSLLYSEGPMLYDDDGNIIMPNDTRRIDKTVSIGAVLEINYEEMSKHDYFVSFHPQLGSLLTTTSGLSKLEFDVPYNNFRIALSDNPDSATEEILNVNLSQIASRTAGIEVNSFIATSRENKQIALALLIATGAIVFLFFAICASMINNALSARIRASKREIGTIRAVGASEREITRSYLWQLASMFVWGTSIGMIVQLVLCGWLRVNNDIKAPLPTWQPILFVAILFSICYLNIRSKVSSIIKDSIVENIREL